MFQQRNVAEINPLVEISYATVAPGAVGSGSTVGVSVAFTLGAAGSASPATVALGDQIEIFPPAIAALNGVLCSAAPTATAGTVEVYFANATGGSITPVSGVYRVVATRFPNDIS